MKFNLKREVGLSSTVYNLLNIKKQNFYFSTISFGEVQPFTPSSSFVLKNFTKKRLNKWT